MHTSQFFIEAKTPAKAQSSFSIKQEWIAKAKEQAFEQGKYFWSLAFRFDPEGPDYFVIDGGLMKQLIDYMEQEDENGDKLL